MDWQPIDTAPKDGTAVILGWVKARMVAPASWKRGVWCHYGERYMGELLTPDAWQPLPKPPTSI